MEEFVDSPRIGCGDVFTEELAAFTGGQVGAQGGVDVTAEASGLRLGAEAVRPLPEEEERSAHCDLDGHGLVPGLRIDEKKRITGGRGTRAENGLQPAPACVRFQL